MKKFLICGLFFTLCLYFANGSIDEERRFREGSSFSRKMRSCSFFCSIKGNRRTFNQTLCYRIPSQNVVATDCVFKCLRSKGESPEAKTCPCKNGVCEAEAATTAAPETESTTTESTQTTTESETTQNPNTNAPNTNAPTTNAPNTNSPIKLRRNGNQGKKGVRGQNSKKGNRNKQKS